MLLLHADLVNILYTWISVALYPFLFMFWKWALCSYFYKNRRRLLHGTWRCTILFVNNSILQEYSNLGYRRMMYVTALFLAAIQLEVDNHMLQYMTSSSFWFRGHEIQCSLSRPNRITCIFSLYWRASLYKINDMLSYKRELAHVSSVSFSMYKDVTYWVLNHKQIHILLINA